jgi:vancomycin resistance protein YoaR
MLEMAKKDRKQKILDLASKHRCELAIGFLALVVFYILLSVVLAKTYRGKVMPQYYFLGGSLNLVSADDLQTHLQSQVDKISEMIFVRSRFETFPSENFIVNTKGGLSLNNETFKDVEDYTFQGSWLQSYKIIFGFVRPKKDLGDLWLSVDTKVLRENYLKKDGLVAVKGSGDAHMTVLSDGRLAVSESMPEIADDFQNIKKSFSQVFKKNDYQMSIYIVNLYAPRVTTQDWQKELPKVRDLIKTGSTINFVYNGNVAVVNSSQIPKLLTISNDKFLVFNPNYIAQFLHESSLARFEQTPKEPVFIYDKEKMRVLSFKKEIVGSKFGTEKLALDLNKELLSQQILRKNIVKNLQITSWQPSKTLGDINPFGINDLLGTGYSSMRNSAPERFANINNGINKLDGFLIAPGAEFSTVGALSPFSVSNGYVEGLAIKKRKILPEIGGGMCQVSTTLFRAAMNSGLKITDRSNHSVVVNYYDDPRNGLPGTDATIYDPAPDFKFANDTQNYIFIDTRVEAGGQIYFDIWGKRDGRKGYFTEPRVLSRTESKEEPIYDLSSSVPTGQVRCSGPFNGMSTIFTYIRTLPNGQTENTPYFSYYRPQGQNCLVGQQSV